MANWTLVARTVTSAIEQHGPDLAARLERDLFPEGVPEDLTMAMVVEAVAGSLLRSVEELRRLDVALAMERADDPQARDARDDAIAELRARIMGARSGVEGAHGSAALVRTGLAGALPSSPDELVQHAEAAAALLAEVDLGDGAEGIRVDGARVAEQLREGATRVSSALTAVQRESREEQQALRERDLAAEVVARKYSGYASLTTGVAIAVDRPDVAERARPTARRRSGLPEPEDEPVVDPVVAVDPTPPAPVDDGPPPA